MRYEHLLLSVFVSELVQFKGLVSFQSETPDDASHSHSGSENSEADTDPDSNDDAESEPATVSLLYPQSFGLDVLLRTADDAEFVDFVRMLLQKDALLRYVAFAL